MPGLIGFYGDFGKNQPQEFLKKMARALEHEDLYQVELYHEQMIGLGRVSLGILNPEPQPIWSEDKNLALIMEGELFDYQELKQDLTERGHHFQMENSDAEFVLHLYEEFGEDCITKLNGAFVLAIWDRQAQKLLLANDRIGQYPLYYAQNAGGLLFASGLRALLADPTLSHTINEVAIAQFFTFGHVLSDHTLLTNVRRIPPASLLTFANGQLNIRPYWQMRHPDHYPLRDETEWMDDLSYYLRQAVTRQAPGDLSAGILLSGGIDSRVLLAFLPGSPATQPIHTFTWGIPGCDDAKFAGELAAKTGTRHQFFELKPDWLLSNAENGVRITDGLGNIINLHAMATLEEEAKYAQVIYKGFMGDGMMGFSLRPQHWANYDDDVRIQAHFQVHRDQGAVMFGPPEQQDLFTDSFQREVAEAVLDDYRLCLNEAGSALLADQRNVFGLRQRVPRLALNGVEVVRSRAAVRLPFCDNDLVDFALTIPPGLRYQRRLITNTFSRDFPTLAQIPITETGLPMMDCARDLFLRIEGVVRWHLRARGFKRVSYPRHRPYKDYNGWFRSVLRGWVEETLLNKHALARGYFKPDYVQQLVKEHMAGANHSGKLGAFLSLELWHRQFMD